MNRARSIYFSIASTWVGIKLSYSSSCAYPAMWRGEGSGLADKEHPDTLLSGPEAREGVVVDLTNFENVITEHTVSILFVSFLF